MTACYTRIPFPIPTGLIQRPVIAAYAGETDLTLYDITYKVDGKKRQGDPTCCGGVQSAAWPKSERLGALYPSEAGEFVFVATVDTGVGGLMSFSPAKLTVTLGADCEYADCGTTAPCGSAPTADCPDCECPPCLPCGGGTDLGSNRIVIFYGCTPVSNGSDLVADGVSGYNFAVLGENGELSSAQMYVDGDGYWSGWSAGEYCPKYSRLFGYSLIFNEGSTWAVFTCADPSVQPAYLGNPPGY